MWMRTGSVTLATHMSSMGYVSLTQPLHGTKPRPIFLGLQNPALMTSLAKQSLSLEFPHSYDQSFLRRVLLPGMPHQNPAPALRKA